MPTNDARADLTSTTSPPLLTIDVDFVCMYINRLANEGGAFPRFRYLVFTKVEE